MKKIFSMLFFLAVLLFCIQTMGSYLVEEMRVLQETPELEITQETQVVHYKVLRLDTMEYYTIQIGTYDDIMSCQEKINQLAAQGYRPFVSRQTPYKIRVGCFAEEAALEQIPEALRNSGQDVHLEKLMLNQHSLKFDEQNVFLLEQLSPLLTSYDVVLKHSLTMFQQWQATQYTTELWREMIAQLTAEGQEVSSHLEKLLTDHQCDEQLASQLLDLQKITGEYLVSLERLAEQPEDLSVWMAQSYLLELLEQYDEIIVTNTQSE